MQVRQVQDIQYQLLPGADRQTTDIVIERDGVVRVRPPLRMTPEQVDETVFSKRMWIYRNMAEWHDLNATRIVREWVNGESFLYLGSSYRLSLVDAQDEALKLKDGRFQLLRSVILAKRNINQHVFMGGAEFSQFLARRMSEYTEFYDAIGLGKKQ